MATVAGNPGGTYVCEANGDTGVALIVMMPMVCSLSCQQALKEPVRGGHVAGETDQLDHRVLVDRKPLIAQGGEVAILVGTEEQILRVQEEHRGGRCPTPEAAIQHHVRIHVLERLETEFRHILIPDTLQRL